MNCLFVFGTRPEAIKMAPLVKKFQVHPAFDVKVCVTGQHRQMLDQVLAFFSIQPDFDLNLMQPNQTLFDITARALTGLRDVLAEYAPDCIFVQGDTTTAMAGALAGFYQRIPVAHIEAGLRSGNKYSPYPEEVNRILTGHVATYHFAPTERAVQNLRNEGVTENVWNVGNTVIDALFLGLDIVRQPGEETYRAHFEGIDFTKRIILVTGHRRESFGEPFRNICHAIKQIQARFDDVVFVYPVHLNPNVRAPVNEILTGVDRIHLIEPLEYPQLIWLMNRAHIILTDSGGIQEEAPSLGKPVLVMRDVTERTEGIEAGTARLVGTDTAVIVNALSELLTSEDAYRTMATAKNPYGDGSTCDQIVRIFTQRILPSAIVFNK